jgi:hypothetical protein
MGSFVAQMLLLPFTVNRQMFELFGTTARGLEELADRNIRGALAPATEGPPRDVPPAAPAVPAAAATPRLPVRSPERFVHPRTSPMSWRPTDPTTTKEKPKMADTNLNDEMVKLVEYTILTIERGREEFLEQGRALVTDDLTGDAFPNARIAEWTKKNPGRISEHGNATGDGIRASTLRVYYNVLDRWPKEDLKKDEKTVRHDEEQLKILREIADRLPLVATPPPGGGGPSSKDKSSSATT